MVAKRMLVVALLALWGAGVFAEETVGVSGSRAQYPSSIERKVGDKQVKLNLTGTALRKKSWFNVYTIGSYLQDGVAVETAEELAEKDCAKQLHLIMERDVSGKTMAEAFVAAVRMNYDESSFEEEMKALNEFLQDKNLKKGDHVRLTHVPQVGLHCDLAGKEEVLIKNVQFGQAIWEIYLGKNNLGEAIKKGLVSRL